MPSSGALRRGRGTDLHCTGSASVLQMAERVRRVVSGQAVLVDLQGEPDVATAAMYAMDRVHETGREVDEFVIDAYQEQSLGVPMGSLKTLLGYPVRVIYRFEED